MRRFKHAVSITLVFLCCAASIYLGTSGASADDRPRIRRAIERLGDLRFMPSRPAPASELADETPESEAPDAPEVDPYKGFEQWCEPLNPTPCTSDDQCALARDGRPRRCIKPWWTARGETLKVCAGKWPTKHEQKWRKDRLAAIVDHVCGRGCDEDQLAAFLGIVAARESSWRPWKSHRLNGDVRANRDAWADQRARYTGNPHYAARDRWQGYGMFGQNSPLGVHFWDPMAPPEVLCREVESVSVYLERARGAARKQEFLGIDPTWATVHAAVAGGKIRPSAKSIENFRKVAARVGLRGDDPVTPRSFGRGLRDDVRLRRLDADLLRTSLDARFGAVFRARSVDHLER